MIKYHCGLSFKRLYRGVAFCLALLAIPAITLANPVVGNIAAGQVSIQQTSSTTTVNQASSKAIINWSSFNIGKNESTHFQQPSGGVALNRISPTAGASQIYGQLTATGQIILSNPAGVYFGPTSYVNVGGLIATTGHISDQNFMSGNYQFDKVDGYSGSIVNEGQIVAAQNGLVALVAPGVVNKGNIQANLGHVVLASGDAFTVNFSGDNLINFKITSGASHRGTDKDGNTLNDGVKNTGSILADAGTVLITARAAAGVLDNSIDMRGSVQARSIYSQNGTIIISGDPNAGATTVSASLDASAGSTGTNGGFIETSGHLINLSGVSINLSAPGVTGTWLIDPADLTICTACTTTASGFNAGSINSNLSVTDLTTALASANVIVQTTVNGSGGNGDIFVNTPINWSSGNKLTLSAYRNITASASISNTGGASVVLQADNSGTGVGTVSFTGGNNVSLSGGSGTVKIYYNPVNFGTQDLIYSGGTTPTQYMLINNANNLQSVNSYLTQNFALGKDIDASSISNFSPITIYSGSFDGQNHSVKNLIINSSDANVGLFGIIDTTAIISNLAVNGSVTSGDNANIGLLAGSNTGTITNVFSYGQVIGGAANYAGGLVGSNSGSIKNAYSTAYIAAGSGSTTGGLVGNNTNTISDTFAISNVAGSNSGTLTRSYTASMTQSNYTGFDFASTWGIINGLSYPYLLSFYPTTPRAISGQVMQYSSAGYYSAAGWAAQADSLLGSTGTGLVAVPIGGLAINLESSNNVVDSVRTAGDGSYYFLESQGTIANNQAFMTYIAGDSTYKANTISVGANGNGSIASLPLILGKVYIGRNDNGANIVPTFAVLRSTGDFGRVVVSNDTLSLLMAGVDSNDLLYSTSGHNLDIKDGYSFISGKGTDFHVTGNITATNGAITFGDIFYIWQLDPSYNNSVTIQTLQSGNIHLAPLSIGLWYQGSSATLNLSSANNIGWLGSLYAYNTFRLDSLGNPAPTSGSLNLSAAFTNQSIFVTPKKADAGNNRIYNFNLLKGKFYLDYSSIPSPLNWSDIRYINNFQINSGIMPAAEAEYLRINGGNGTPLSPYKVNYQDAVQGIGSTIYTLSASWSLDDLVGLFYFSVGPSWNNYAGFVPIGNASHPFTGTFTGPDALPFAPVITINRPNENNIGLFGVTSSSAVISNIYFSGAAVTGKNNVGILVGLNYGTIRNIYIDTSMIIGQNNVGGLVGYNAGTITNSEVIGNRILGQYSVGGITGYNAGSISNILVASYTASSQVTGGIAGTNTGTIANSFWDTDFTGQSTAAGSNSGTLDHVIGGCYGGICDSGSHVDLSNKLTYLSGPDGGLNLINTSWDFTNTFGILSGTNGQISYPYLQLMAGPTSAFNALTGIPGFTYPSVISGYLSSPYANQLVIISGGYLFNAQISYGVLGTVTITGNNGFFYSLFANGNPSIDQTNFLITLALSGSKATGSLTFLPPPATSDSMFTSTTNTHIIATPANGPATDNVALSLPIIVALSAGESYDQILASYGNINLQEWSQKYFFTEFDLHQRVIEFLYLTNINANSTYYFQQGLDQKAKDYLAASYAAGLSLNDIYHNLDVMTRNLYDKYEITPIAPICHN